MIICAEALVSQRVLFVRSISTRACASLWWIPLSPRRLDDSSAAARDCSADHVGLSSLIPHFSTGKSSLRADLDNPSQPSSPSVRHEIMDDKCSDLNPNLIQDYKPVAHLE